LFVLILDEVCLTGPDLTPGELMLSLGGVPGMLGISVAAGLSNYP